MFYEEENYWFPGIVRRPRRIRAIRVRSGIQGRHRPNCRTDPAGNGIEPLDLYTGTLRDRSGYFSRSCRPADHCDEQAASGIGSSGRCAWLAYSRAEPAGFAAELATHRPEPAASGSKLPGSLTEPFRSRSVSPGICCESTKYRVEPPDGRTVTSLSQAEPSESQAQPVGDRSKSSDAHTDPSRVFESLSVEVRPTGDGTPQWILPDTARNRPARAHVQFSHHLPSLP